MAAKVCAVLIDGPHASTVQHQLDARNDDRFAAQQGGDRGAALKGQRRAAGCDDADDVFLNRQARIDVAYREDRPIGIAPVAEVEVTAKRQRFNQNRGVGMRGLLFRPCRRDDAGLFQLDTLFEQWAGHRLAKKGIEDRIGVHVIHHLVRPAEKPRCTQDRPRDPLAKSVGEIGLGRAAEGAIWNAKVTPAKRVVHHLAHFHDAARIGARFAIDLDPENQDTSRQSMAPSTKILSHPGTSSVKIARL